MGDFGYENDQFTVKLQLVHTQRLYCVHNILLIGTPGSGKNMLARRLPTILPDMEWNESLETTKIYSVMGLLKNEQNIIRSRPFRA